MSNLKPKICMSPTFGVKWGEGGGVNYDLNQLKRSKNFICKVIKYFLSA